MNRRLSLIALFIFFSGLTPEAGLFAQTDLLDSLRSSIQKIEKDSINLTSSELDKILIYLNESKAASSKENIIYAYQQLAFGNYQLGNSNLSLKYYKLYVLELESWTKIKEYRERVRVYYIHLR